MENINLILERRGRCSKRTSISSIKVNNNIYKSEEEIADNLNTYFSEIGEKLSSDLDNTDRTFVEYITPLQLERV